MKRFLLLAWALACATALAQPLPDARPDEAGLSPERLGRITEWMRTEAAAGRIPGAVLLISRHGRVVYEEAVGLQDPARPDAMRRDSIFRIYSMTKPLVSAAALRMAQEGRLVLDAPVARYIPAFAKVKVGVERARAGGEMSLARVAPSRAMTVRDLLRHTSGLTYGNPGGSMVARAYDGAKIGWSREMPNGRFADRLARMPLMHHPGTKWEYGHSTDVLGRVLEVADGRSLSAILKARLFDPLGMKDTDFHLADPERQARIAEPLPQDGGPGPESRLGDPRRPSPQQSGGGGLVSTAGDYMRFLRMLLNGGTLDGVRVLSPKAVRAMTTDQLAGIAGGPDPGFGFGLGFAVRRPAGEAPVVAPPGEYSWGGVAGTAFWVDPSSGLCVVFMMQSLERRAAYQAILRRMVYAAVER